MSNCEPLRGKVRYKSSGYDHDKCFYAKDIASAVRFYKRYIDNKELLMSEETEAFLVWIHLHDEGDFKTQQELDDSYRKWFVDYCFGDVIEK